ncbi:rhodanese-like domain-containing protein [Irregularibacter muris]|uniref:Rhodanese-like domain-containing protein n=1 Tax=Irregularibacter muris TaxID=1796619 RepID=A0AAE3HI13_9FIRM|nr:rhodanese-like domain-containing protein [Irregularibacter muris]MCR1898928.1 rhodanese-like domain-containing protein [Irregularibacter muris]
MLKKNRVLVLLLVLLFVASFAFTACSGGETPSATDEENKGAQETVKPEENVVETAANNYFDTMENSHMMKADEFIEKVKAGAEDVLILDIRRAEDYDQGHIKGAVNLPFGTDVSDNLENIPKDKPLLVYCYSGQTASQTIALLHVAGFDATNITSGWNGGISQVEGYEEAVETTKNELPEAKTEIDPEIKKAIADYYAGFETVQDTDFAINKVSVENTKKMLDEKDESIFLLDIRAEEDYKEGHIEGAVNIPYGKGMQEQFNTLPKDKTIVVICYSGQTADQTNAILRLLGYKSVGMSGGMKGGWEEAGYPVVTE